MEKEIDTHTDKDDYSIIHDLGDDEEIDFNLDEVRKFRESLSEPIVCIEMINNNKLYIKYESDWEIKDV